MTINDVILKAKEGTVLLVTFGDESWYVTRKNNFIRYCDSKGDNISDTITLTPSNLEAFYYPVGGLTSEKQHTIIK